MIPETLGHRVKIGSKVLPIVAWDEEGQPLVVGELGLRAAKWVAGRTTGRTDAYTIISPSG